MAQTADGGAISPQRDLFEQKASTVNALGSYAGAAILNQGDPGRLFIPPTSTTPRVSQPFVNGAPADPTTGLALHMPTSNPAMAGFWKGDVKSTWADSIMNPIGNVFGALTDKDPSKILTGPMMFGLHHFGIGQQGDEWDKGVLGLFGVGITKSVRLATAVALDASAIPFGNLSQENIRKAWDIAFDPTSGITPGSAALSEVHDLINNTPNSILEDPLGAQKTMKWIDSTWYGDMAAGVIDMGVFALVDPTRGIGKVAKASRAAKYVPNRFVADQISEAVNEGFAKSPTVAGAATSTMRSLVGLPQDVEYQAGYMLGKMKMFNDPKTGLGLQDTRTIINRLEPLIATGGDYARNAVPGVAEMMADLGKIADPLERYQAQLNVMLSLTGSGKSMGWLAENVPLVAGKARRLTTASDEIELMKRVTDDYVAKGGDLTTFDFNGFITSHFDTPAIAKEVEAWADEVKAITKFRNAVTAGGEEGQAVGFGTSAAKGSNVGLQVVPRALESVKTAYNDKLMSSFYLQNGRYGRTVRVMNYIGGPGVNGFINVKDPILGNRQLMMTLKEYSDKVATITPDQIKGWSDAYLQAPAGARGEVIHQLNNYLLENVALKYMGDSITTRGVASTTSLIKELTAKVNDGFSRGRAYANQQVLRALRTEDDVTWMHDPSGTSTALRTPHFSTHLEDTAPLFDWRMANDVTEAYFRGEKWAQRLKATEYGAIHFLSWYHRVWKYAQLGRPGLVVRALLDTGMRAVSQIGLAGYMMQALTGSFNVMSKLPGARKIGIVDPYDQSTSLMGVLNSHRADITKGNLGFDAGQVAAKIAENERGAQALEEAAAGYMRAARTPKRSTPVGTPGGRFHRMTADMKAKAKAANDQALALRGMTYDAEGNPIGIAALTKQREEMLSSLQTLTPAQEVYQAGVSSSRTNAQKLRKHGDNYWALVRGDMEQARLRGELVGSDNGLASLMKGEVDRSTAMRSVDRYNWSNVEKDDAFWAQKYAETAPDFQFHTARRVMTEYETLKGSAREGTIPDAVIESFLKDKQVTHDYNMMFGAGTREQKLQWLSDLRLEVKAFAPTPAARAMLLGDKPVTAAMVERMVPSSADRWAIFGPNVALSDSKLITRAFDTFFHWSLDLPDVAFARIPMANGLYHTNIKDLLPAYMRNAQAEGRTHLTPIEAQEIHNLAKQRAINDVRRDMYDVHRFVGAHGAMTMIAPFFAPWEDAMMSWGRLFYDNPARAGQLLRYLNAPQIMGAAINGNGKPVLPFDGTPLSDTYIVVPLKFIGQGDFKFAANMSSFNSIAQGSVPFSPGVGPLVQFSAAYMVGQVLMSGVNGNPIFGPLGKKVWSFVATHPDSILNQTFFATGDVPKTDLKSLLGAQMPSYMRKFTDALLGDSPFAFGNIFPEAYGTRKNMLIIQWREQHGGADPTAGDLDTIDQDAYNGAKAAATVSMIASFGFGISGNSRVEGQYYIDKMHALNAIAPQLKAVGTTPADVFAKLYPSAARLNWSFSENKGGIEATVNATTGYLTHADLIDKNPDIAWWILGKDNLLATLPPGDNGTGNPGAFNNSAYNQQMSAGLRKQWGKDDIDKATDIAMAQGLMDQFNIRMQAYLNANGISSLQSKDAGGLAQYKANFTAQLRQLHPEWALWQDTRDTGKRNREIEQITRVLDDPRQRVLNQRSDIITTRKYMMARKALSDHAVNDLGIRGWQTSNKLVDDRRALWQYGTYLAKSDIIFQLAWNRLFESEFRGDLIKGSVQ